MPVSIRFRLLLLVLSVLVPWTLGTAWLISSALQAERAAHEQRLRDTARALAMVVDHELAQRVAIARVLAQSRWLDAGPAIAPPDLRAYEQLARRSIQGLDGWIELRTQDRLLLDTRWPPGAPARADPAGSALAEVPQVLPLRVGNAAPHAAVVQPVERGGRVVMNLTLALVPAELQRIIDAQHLPPDWVGTVMDDHGTVVARHPGGGANIGRSATADVRRRIAARSEGLFQSVSLDGSRVVGYFSMSPQGWSYISAMPRAEFAGAISQAARGVLLGALALLALPVAGALWVSRRIVGPVQALKVAAARMKNGQEVHYRPTGIIELDAVGRALAETADGLRHHRAELERQVSEAVARTRQAEQRVSGSQRVEALGRLTGGVAHDFNNLLGVISNNLHLVERGGMPPETQAPLAAMRRAVQAGSQLTQHLLRFAGRRPVRPQALALQRWLPELLDLLQGVLGRRIGTVVRVHPETAPVRVDAGELELALVNLALNAREAMPGQGGLRIGARNASEADSAGLPGVPGRRFVMITVSDDGVGIAPELVAHVFEPFFSTKAGGQGAGLGLSQVHGFCRQAGGDARLASTPGVGTAVTLLLPAAEAAHDDLAGNEAAAAPPELAGLRLLLVDDNEELRVATAELLRRHGINVQCADSADDALRLLAARPFFDVVLSDVVMPGTLDGMALARRIRHDHPALPVVLISGYNTSATEGGLRVLPKPCEPRELLQALYEATRASADA